MSRLVKIKEKHSTYHLGDPWDRGIGEDDIDWLVEQVEKFQEVQSWFWWLKRRTHDGKTPKSVMAIFLQGISKIFDD
jgi:hypothetical protein